MRRIESLENEMRGTITYDLEDGQYLNVDAEMVGMLGIAAVLRMNGSVPPEGRLPVFWAGTEAGTLPAAFGPLQIRSLTSFYRPRPGDFKRTDRGWEAANTLGPGDLEAVPEFQWKEGLR
jgi:hypothetical protein